MSLYEVQKLLFHLNRDRRLQARFREERNPVLAEYRLGDAERQAIEAADVGRLYTMGVHPLLLLGFGTRAGYAWPDYIARLKKAQEEQAAA
jgi:hypothetical protein